ncbi:MAG: 2Fe-2S iron-sulfur cluster-binding protein [Planctomycetes bacterium]|nr:2Fe-2S iron-sulfur cluster-binding protein [Planctomycetota bacterium]
MSTYRIRFLPDEITVETESNDLVETRDGLPGSILALALKNHLEIDHACGGVCACSTCHVIVREGFDSLSEASETEEDMLDNAPGVTLQSRLACQAVADGSCDLVVEVPNWNRNLVSEGH